MAVHVPLHCPSFAKPGTEPFSRFNVLKAYLENDAADVNSAAITVAAPINEPVSGTPLTRDDIAGGVSNLWATVLVIVAQVPYDHPWQDKLVALVSATRFLPEPAYLEAGSWLNRYFRTVWRELDYFGRCVCEDWNDKSLLHERFTQEQFEEAFSKDEWVNFNAFLARISAQRIQPLESYGIDILSAVLEGSEFTAPITPSMLNDNLPAAAVWLLYAGGLMDESLGLNAKSGLSKDERWGLWKERLGELMRDETLHRNTRDWAMGAFQAMDHISLILPETSKL